MRPTSPKRSFLVFVEGLQTEEIYLKDWERSLRDRVTVSIGATRGVPMTLVEAAVDAKQQAEREARRGRGDAWDEVWCVFDRDEHPRIEDAYRLADTHGIHIAMSNPCIEVWFLLHEVDQRAHLDRNEAQRLARELYGFEKTPTRADLSRMRSNFDLAATRSRALDAKHEGDGSPPATNPSSSLWRLIESMQRKPDV